jgi:hypothetical protein
MIKFFKVKNSGRLLILSLFILLLLMVSNLKSFNHPNTGTSTPNLGCPDLSKCSGLASCGESGDPDNCVIQCAGGTVIYCTKSN